MLKHIAALLQQQPGKGADGSASKEERESFNAHLQHDAKDVITKLLVATNADLKQIVDEIVQQATDFWQGQLRRVEEAHRAEVAALKAESAGLSTQLDDTVKMYNQVVQSLKSQLEEAHEATEAARRIAEAKLQAAAALHQSVAADAGARDEANNHHKAQLTDLTRQLATAQAATRDAELKAQQKRLVLVQTVEKQHAELEDLRRALKLAQERDMKLTAVSEHLLSKQATLVSQLVEMAAPDAQNCEQNGASTAPYDPAADVSEVLYTEQQIRDKQRELGRQVSVDYAELQPMIMPILKGGFIVAADLLRALQPCPRGLVVEFVHASSYGAGTETSGRVTVSFDRDVVSGRHVLLVDDLCDSGLTLMEVTRHVVEAGAASVKSLVLLDKKARRKVDYVPDYVGFDCPNKWIVGHGMDTAQIYRSLPFIGVLKSEVAAQFMTKQ